MCSGMCVYSVFSVGLCTVWDFVSCMCVHKQYACMHAYLHVFCAYMCLCVCVHVSVCVSVYTCVYLCLCVFV